MYLQLIILQYVTTISILCDSTKIIFLPLLQFYFLYDTLLKISKVLIIFNL
jgi:hypothetical protein